MISKIFFDGHVEVLKYIYFIIEIIFIIGYCMLIIICVNLIY